MAIRLSWDIRKGSVRVRWNRVFSLEREKGEVWVNVLGLRKPIRPGQRRVHFPVRWSYLRGILSFIKGWKLKRVEGTFSFPDPVVNGLLFGLVSAFDARNEGRSVHLAINFLGKNECRGEAAMAHRTLSRHLRGWLLAFIREMRAKGRGR